MKSRLLMTLACATFALPALADDVTYRKDIQPLIKAQCSECHGSDSPTLAEFLLDQEKYTRRTSSAPVWIPMPTCCS